jgi:hypothetical protein
MEFIIIVPSVNLTYDHRSVRTGHPVRNHEFLTVSCCRNEDPGRCSDFLECKLCDIIPIAFVECEDDDQWLGALVLGWHRVDNVLGRSVDDLDDLGVYL